MPRTATRRPARLAHPQAGLIVAAAALAAGTLVLSGCAGGAAAGDADRPEIVATTTQTADFVRQLVGESADVVDLIGPGQSAHSFDPSAAQLLAIAEADAVVKNGAGLDTWIDDAIASAGYEGPVVDASEGIELFGTHEHGDEHDEHGDGHDEHGDEAHAEDDHAEGEHDHGEGNPHIWTSPSNAVAMVRTIAAGLEAVPGLDPETIETAETAYLGKLADLDAWIRENVDRVPVDQRLLVTNHDAFTYLLHDYDITLVGSVIPSFDDNAEPSAAEIDELVAGIRSTGVRAVFAEQSISPKTADTIAREADVTVYSGDDALYGDSLGAEGSEGATYLGSQVHNVRLILESWGVQATEPPASLRG